MRTNGTVQESESINVIRPVNAVKLISSIEAVVQRCTVKKVFLEIRKIDRKTPVPESLF